MTSLTIHMGTVAGTYGPAIQYDSLGNLRLGHLDGNPISYRFRAEASAALNSVNYYTIVYDAGGYSAGTHGTTHISLQADSAGYPAGSELATVTDFTPIDGAETTKSFSVPYSVTSGLLYHIVFQNVDADPSSNYASIDCVRLQSDLTPRQPRFADTDWAACSYVTGAWMTRPHHTPILSLAYAGGATQGLGYIDCSLGANAGVVNGTNYMARESFRVSGGNRTVTGAYARVMRHTGDTDPLVIRLETAAGVEIESVSIPAATFPPADAAPPGADSKGGYGGASFVSSHVLTSGQSYNLRLSTAAGSTYWMTPIRRGSGYGYAATTYFADGLAYKTTNGTDWVNLGPGDADMQFYLVTG
jgi:hypothetical protein